MRPTAETKVASGIHIVSQTASRHLLKTENSYLGVFASWREVPLSALARISSYTGPSSVSATGASTGSGVTG
jgi:hypothetical protein